MPWFGRYQGINCSIPRYRDADCSVWGCGRDRSRPMGDSPGPGRTAARRTRRPAPRNQRTASAYIFGAACLIGAKGCDPDHTHLQIIVPLKITTIALPSSSPFRRNPRCSSPAKISGSSCSTTASPTVCLQILRRSRRPSLHRREQAHRSALAIVSIGLRG